MLQKKIAQSISNLDAWLDTWRKNGGIYGYVVHQHKEKMDNTNPDVLTQSSCMLAHINIYKETRNKKWLKKAIEEAEFLSKTYIDSIHLFANSSFEHKPFRTTLVYNSLACYALLKIYALAPKAAFFRIARDCLENGIIANYWNAKRGCFWDKIGRYKKTIWRAEKINTLNMNSITIAALVELSRATKNKKYVKKYALPSAEFILKYQETCGSLRGAYNYDDTGIWKRYISLYIAWTMRGLLELFEYTNERRYLNSCKMAGEFLVKKMIDKRTNLFYHRYEKSKSKPYPEWVAAAGAPILVIKKLEKYGVRYDIDSTLNSVIKKQYNNGAFPNSVGYSNIFIQWVFRPNIEKTTWRDAISIPGWNSVLLEALTENDFGKSVPQPKVSRRIFLKTDPDIFGKSYSIEDTKKHVKFFDGNNIVALYEKTNPEKIFNNMKLIDDNFISQKKFERKLKILFYPITLLLLFLIYLLFYLS